jgi:hypothetical protein
MTALTDRFIDRDRWGARPPRSRDGFDPPHRGIAIHWTGLPRAENPHWPTCYDQMGGVQDFHMDAATHRWPDIGYNAVVCNHGFVFEGRWFDAQPTAQGVGGENFNDDYFAVAWIGGKGQTPSEAAKVGIGLVVDEAVRRGFPRVLRPHSWFKTTTCPGDVMRGLIVAGEWDATPVPVPPPPPVPVEGRIPILTVPSVSLPQMQRWAKGRGGTSRFVELAVHMWSAAILLGEDPAVPYGIAAHETRNGTFGGVLDATFHNWGGIKTAAGGANDDPNAHARFPSDRIGAAAVVQHAARYAGLELPADIIVDPRYHQITGRADHLEDSGWRWAGADHGANVARLVRMMRLA